ncbi:MAG: hypothetical protein QXI43_04815 [Candidatus Nitrosocaldus sp.]
MEWSCARCGKPIGDRDSVITRTGRMLCYWCADLEREYWNDEYYDDDRKRYRKDKHAGEDPYAF